MKKAPLLLIGGEEKSKKKKKNKPEKSGNELNKNHFLNSKSKFHKSIHFLNLRKPRFSYTNNDVMYFSRHHDTQHSDT